MLGTSCPARPIIITSKLISAERRWRAKASARESPTSMADRAVNEPLGNFHNHRESPLGPDKVAIMLRKLEIKPLFLISVGLLLGPALGARLGGHCVRCGAVIRPATNKIFPSHPDPHSQLHPMISNVEVETTLSYLFWLQTSHWTGGSHKFSAGWRLGGGVQLFCKTMAIVMLSSGSEDPVVTVTVEEAGSQEVGRCGSKDP